MSAERRPRIGIGVIVTKGSKILLGERLSGHGAGTFQIPGDHLEFRETFEAAAIREVAEEAGLTDVIPKKIVSLGNDIAYDKHYVSIGVHLQCPRGDPRDAEPEHSRGWKWYNIKGLPEPIFPHSKRVIENWLTRTLV